MEFRIHSQYTKINYTSVFQGSAPIYKSNLACGLLLYGLSAKDRLLFLKDWKTSKRKGRRRNLMGHARSKISAVCAFTEKVCQP